MLSPTLLPRPIIRLLVRAWAAWQGAKVRYEGETIRIERDGRTMVLRADHLPYVVPMIAHFDTYHGAVESEGGVVDYSAPRRQTYRPSGLRFWTPAFPEEPEAIDGYLRQQRPGVGDTVFDLGAHAGLSAYAFAGIVGPTGRVVAIEPDPLAFEMLTRNIADHGLTNIVPVCAAIAGSSGHRRFNADASLGAAFSDLVDRHGLTATREVVTVSFDDLVRRYGVPAFVKMDIEGAELEVLRAALPTLRIHPIAFAVDTHHRVGGQFGGWLSGDYTTVRVERLFGEVAYQAESALVGGFWTTWAKPR